ncbi:MAG: Thymidylate synthase thyX [Parcubacteria group bacterium Athens0714_24]|nr:MAG: Thymidylate synthase thyX [Parcubacteria group bacterium Athens0714_24]
MDFRVKLLGYTDDPQSISVAGALGCFEEQSSYQMLEMLDLLSPEDRDKKEKGVLKNSFGRGHGSVGDQNCFIFSIEDLPRVATLFLCQSEYLSHLQQSLRRARASRGYHLPETIIKSSYLKRVEEILSNSFKLYERLCSAGIPAEDARYLLPLYTRTNIQTLGNARELCHLWHMSQQPGVPSIVKAIVDEMIALAKDKAPYLFEKFGFNFEPVAWYPAPQLFAPSNELIKGLVESCASESVVLLDSCHKLPITAGMVEQAVKGDEAQLANLKHVHFEFLVSMSFVCFHQAVRQRTWNHSVESIYDAVNGEARMVIPPSIKSSSFSFAYEKQHLEMLELFHSLIQDGIPTPEAVGVLPHSLLIFTLIHVNGWNALHSIGKRTCVEAQWEIRNLAWKMARIIKKKLPVLGKWAEPQCITYGGSCPEVKDCGYYKKLQKGK